MGAESLLLGRAANLPPGPIDLAWPRRAGSGISLA
jgi:hypothetical protein